MVRESRRQTEVAGYQQETGTEVEAEGRRGPGQDTRLLDRGQSP